jgi:hypothetical protein
MKLHNYNLVNWNNVTGQTVKGANHTSPTYFVEVSNG